MNYHDARDFRLFAESFIYGIRTIHTDIQTRIPFYTSMWGSLRLAPTRAVSASCGKWFHIDADLELGTKDDWKALVCARG